MLTLDPREDLSRSVPLWIWLKRIFKTAIPVVATRVSCRWHRWDGDEHQSQADVSPEVRTSRILGHFEELKYELEILDNLLLLARNMLGTRDPRVAQDLCLAVHFDQEVFQTVSLCTDFGTSLLDDDCPDGRKRTELGIINDDCE